MSARSAPVARGSCPAGVGNTALGERGQAAANVDLGPSLRQRPVNLSGSLAAEVTFKDAYDGGALGNVSIEILPSGTKTISTNSVPLLWNPDVDSLSSRVDANFARSAITAGSSVGGLLTANGWESKTQGCTDFRNEAALSAHVRRGRELLQRPLVRIGHPGAQRRVCLASRWSTRDSARRRPRTTCRSHPASTGSTT